MADKNHSFRFDVAFSFAGTHRKKVLEIATLVAAKLGKENVFYDDWYEAEILGSDMAVLLQRFYHEKSLMVVADVSEDYADRSWCQAEAQAIRALRFKIDARDQTARLRLLNARFGPGEVPGVFETEGVLDAIAKSAEHCASIILERHALLVKRLEEEAEVSGTVFAPLPPYLEKLIEEETAQSMIGKIFSAVALATLMLIVIIWLLYNP